MIGQNQQISSDLESALGHRRMDPQNKNHNISRHSSILMGNVALSSDEKAQINNSTIKDLLESSILRDLQFMQDEDVPVKNYFEPIEENDPKRSTQVVSPWPVVQTTESEALAAQRQQLNTTQSSLNNIPFRNAQIISKIMSDSKVSISSSQSNISNTSKNKHRKGGRDKVNKETDEEGNQMRTDSKDSQVNQRETQGSQDSDSSRCLETAQFQQDNKILIDEGKISSRDRESAQLVDRYREIQRNNKQRNFQIGAKTELMEVDPLANKDDYISDMLGSPKMRKRKKQ